MKRHPSLVPLSHDHHHALVEARRLRRAAEADAAEREAAADRFLRFFSAESIRHFRDEEELVFPLLAGADGRALELLTRALLEHQRAHALVRRLAAGPDADVMRELGALLEGHVRLEERDLFPLIEETLPDELDLAASRAAAEPRAVDLLRPAGTGPLWGTATDDLNATLLAWPAGGGATEHVNAERDVLVVVLAGAAVVTLDGEPHEVRAGQAIVLEKGRSRSIAAGPDGVRYLSVHRRRPPLQIGRAGC